MTTEPIGTCYEDAWRFLIKEEEGELIHGTVESLGRRIGHAWVELPTGFIWEPESRQFIKKADFQALAKPQEEARYNITEAAIMLARVGKHGPWTKEEKAKATETETLDLSRGRMIEIPLDANGKAIPTESEGGNPGRETEPESGILELEDVGREWDKLTKLQRQPIVERANLPSSFAIRTWAELPLSKKDAIRMNFREVPAVGGNPARVRFDRASIDSAIAAAKRLESEKDLYVFATHLGYTIDRRPPPGTQSYVIVHPNGSTETIKPIVGGNPIPEELDLARTLAIIDSRPKGRIIESKLREEFGDAVIDALRQGSYVVSGSAGYNPPLLVSLKGRELIQGGNPMGKVITKEEAIGLLERLSMTPGEAARSLVADEAERREIMQTVQQRVKREQNKWAPMDPRTGPPLPRIFAGLRWPWEK